MQNSAEDIHQKKSLLKNAILNVNGMSSLVMNFQIVCDGHDHPLRLLTKKKKNWWGQIFFFQLIFLFHAHFHSFHSFQTC
jgi:hypothetical protein